MTPVFHSLSYHRPLENIRIFDEVRARSIRHPENALHMELTKVRDFLRNSPLNDDLTQRLRDWEKAFGHFLRSTSAPIDQTIEGYMDILKNLLIDPITRTPLDHEAYLGSDGFVYAHYSLTLYFDKDPIQPQTRSPMLPVQNDFSIEPHPVARFMVEWLTYRQEYPIYIKHAQVSEDFTFARKKFKVIFKEEREVLLPTPDNLIYVQLLQARERRNRRTVRNVQAHVIPIIENFQAAARQGIADLQGRVAQEFQHLRATQAVNEQQVLGRVEEMSAEHRQVHARLQNDLDTIAEELRNLREENERLNHQLDVNGQNLSQIERDTIALRIAINDAKRANSERNSSWVSGLLVGIAVVSVCVLTTYATGGAGVMVAPTQGGAHASLIVLI